MASNTTREYILTVRQEPKQARMCGVGGKADRRPIDPPPIVQLKVIDHNSSRPSSPSPNSPSSPTSPSSQEPATSSQSFLQNPYYFMFASLAFSDSDEEMHLLKDHRTKTTTGSMVSSLYHLKDPSNNNEDAGFFVFPDLSVRTEGSYRLKLTLFEVVGYTVHFCKSIYTKPFYVFTAKKFPGMEESTPLSCALADQGIKIRIRKDIRVRKRPAGDAPSAGLLENGGDAEKEGSAAANKRRKKSAGKVGGGTLMDGRPSSTPTPTPTPTSSTPLHSYPYYPPYQEPQATGPPPPAPFGYSYPATHPWAQAGVGAPPLPPHMAHMSTPPSGSPAPPAPTAPSTSYSYPPPPAAHEYHHQQESRERESARSPPPAAPPAGTAQVDDELAHSPVAASTRINTNPRTSAVRGANDDVETGAPPGNDGSPTHGHPNDAHAGPPMHHLPHPHQHHYYPHPHAPQMQPPPPPPSAQGYYAYAPAPQHQTYDQGWGPPVPPPQAQPQQQPYGFSTVPVAAQGPYQPPPSPYRPPAAPAGGPNWSTAAPPPAPPTQTSPTVVSGGGAVVNGATGGPMPPPPPGYAYPHHPPPPPPHPHHAYYAHPPHPHAPPNPYVYAAIPAMHYSHPPPPYAYPPAPPHPDREREREREKDRIQLAPIRGPGEEGGKEKKNLLRIGSIIDD